MINRSEGGSSGLITNPDRRCLALEIFRLLFFLRNTDARIQRYILNQVCLCPPIDIIGSGQTASDYKIRRMARDVACQVKRSLHANLIGPLQKERLSAELSLCNNNRIHMGQQTSEK